MVTFRARPTSYRGIRMRSRLEALIAADLDETMPGRWEYEPRAFANQHGQYLPDFVVRDGDLPVLYMEIRPTMELAFAVLPRMQIIWDSEPKANLMVFAAMDGAAGIALFAKGDGDRVWRKG